MVAQLKQAPIVAVQPTGEVVEVAQVVQTAPPQTTPSPLRAAPAQVAKTLPQTASSLPLIALCGLLALGGALMVPSIRKRAL